MRQELSFVRYISLNKKVHVCCAVMDLGCSTVEPLALDAFNQWTTAIEEIWEKHGHIHERATLQYSKLIAEHGLSNMQEYFEENLENAVRKTAPPGFVSPNRIIGGNGRREGAVKDQPFEDEGAGKGRGKQKQGGEDGEIDRVDTIDRSILRQFFLFW